MSSVEDRMAARIDARNRASRAMPPSLERAHPLAQKILKADEIQLDDFVKQRGQDRIDRDKAYVRKRQAEFDASDTPEMKEARKLAEVLEAIIMEQSELSDWFGPNTTSVKTSAFDDIANGVDIALEYSDEERAAYLALGIDVTYSVLGVSKKFQEIRRQIEREQLKPIEYFKSTSFNMQGSLEQVPKIVLGIEREKALDLASKWVQMKEGKLPKTTFVTHPIRLLLLEQIEMQVEGFRSYAEKVANPVAALNYSRIRALIRSAREALPRTISGRSEYGDDAIAKIIAAECRRL